jgi:hypothetical protein
MTKEELEKEAEAEADKVIIGSGMDRTSVIHLKHLLVTMYIQGATKVTKELEAQIEKMKCCGNCAKNGHICVAEEMQGKLCGKNKDKWELRR